MKREKGAYLRFLKQVEIILSQMQLEEGGRILKKQDKHLSIDQYTRTLYFQLIDFLFEY